jgi:hypothetical protein
LALDICAAEVVDAMNKKCSRMTALKLSPWTFTLARLDSVLAVQVNLANQRKKALGHEKQILMMS